MPRLDLAYAGEGEGLHAGVARHVDQMAVLGDARAQLAQGQAPATKDDLVLQRPAWHGLDAAALDMQLVDLVQLFGQVARHDLGEARLHATAGDDQRARLFRQGAQRGQLLGGRPAQVDPRCARRGGRTHAERKHQGWQGGDDGVVLGHQLRCGILIVEIEGCRVQLVAPGQRSKLGFGGLKLGRVHIGQGDAFDGRVGQGVVGGGRPHQPAADHKDFHGDALFLR